MSTSEGATRAAVFGPPLLALVGALLLVAGGLGLSLSGDDDTAAPPPVIRIEPGDETTSSAPTGPPGSTGTPEGSIPPGPAAPNAYLLVSKEGRLLPSGQLQLPPNTSIVGAARSRVSGHWLATGDGHVLGVGTPVNGESPLTPEQAPIVGIAPAGDLSYWLASADGHVYAHGGAPFHGDLNGVTLSAPVVGIAATSDGGYLLLQSDGAVLPFGTAATQVEAGTIPGTSVAIAVSDIGGFLVATADGKVYGFGMGTFGDPSAIGSTSPVVAMAAEPGDSGGYWVVTQDGAVYGFGAAASAQGPNPDFGTPAAIAPR